MLKILFDYQIPYIEDFFSSHFILIPFHHEGEMMSLLHDCDILICRSTIRISASILQSTPIQVVASATSGADHIDISGLKKLNIPFFQAKGSNAHAVCDYITSTLAYLDCHHYSQGHKVGVVGYGAVGQMVTNRIQQLGYLAFNFDPYVNTPNPISFQTLADMDIITLHPNYHLSPPFPTHHLIDQSWIKKLKKNICIINASRGEVVDETAILSPDFHGVYCTDVYKNEPHINPQLIERASLCTPHIAGHSIQSKWRMTSYIAQQIYQKYGFQIPELYPPTINKKMITKKNWQSQALTLYNPEIETHLLKTNPTAECFKKLRKQHQFREDFVVPLPH